GGGGGVDPRGQSAGPGALGGLSWGETRSGLGSHRQSTPVPARGKDRNILRAGHAIEPGRRPSPPGWGSTPLVPLLTKIIDALNATFGDAIYDSELPIGWSC